MATSANVRKVSALNWGGAFTEPVGAMFNTETQQKENRPGTVITDECVAIEGITHTCEFQYQGLATPPTPGAIEDASATGQTFVNSVGGTGGADLVVTLPNCMFISGGIDMTRDPAVQTSKFRYIGTALQPISVGD